MHRKVDVNLTSCRHVPLRGSDVEGTQTLSITSVVAGPPFLGANWLGPIPPRCEMHLVTSTMGSPRPSCAMRNRRSSVKFTSEGDEGGAGHDASIDSPSCTGGEVVKTERVKGMLVDDGMASMIGRWNCDISR